MGRSRKNFIQEMHMKKGALHEQLHIPEGRKIPEARLHKAEHSRDPLLRKRATLADTLRHLHHR